MGNCLNSEDIVHVPSLMPDYPPVLAEKITLFHSKNSEILAQCSDKIEHVALAIPAQNSEPGLDQKKSMSTSVHYKGQYNSSGKRNGIGQLKKGPMLYFGGFKNGRFEGYGILAKWTHIPVITQHKLLIEKQNADPEAKNQGEESRDDSRVHVDLSQYKQTQVDKNSSFVWQFYQGEFHEGRCHGKGYENRKTFTFEGQFSQGMRLFGTLRNSEMEYTGQFQNNKFHGKGLLKFVKSGAKYEGMFEQGKIHGKGKYTGKISNIQPLSSQSDNSELVEKKRQKDSPPSHLYLLQKQDIYIGSFDHGRIHGYGAYVWKDGSTYTGQYFEDRKHGFGRLAIGDQQYCGEWIQGIRKIKDVVTDEINIEVEDERQKMIPREEQSMNVKINV